LVKICRRARSIVSFSVWLLNRSVSLRLVLQQRRAVLQLRDRLVLLEHAPLVVVLQRLLDRLGLVAVLLAVGVDELLPTAAPPEALLKPLSPSSSSRLLAFRRLTASCATIASWRWLVSARIAEACSRSPASAVMPREKVVGSAGW
jgi:hypothetical protein